MSKKKSKSKTKDTTPTSGSLYPEFDEINNVILAELADDPDVALVCDECGQEYVYDAKFIESVCSEPNCYGTLQIINGDEELITLPAAIKNGGTSIGQVQSPSASTTPGVTQYSTGYKSCSHPGDKVIFDFEGKQLFGSNNSSIDEWSGKWDLIIDLAGVVNVPNVVPFISAAAPKRFRALDKLVGKEKELPSEVLRLYWNDMGIPPVGLNFWRALWAELPAKTVIACMGGHGRTGSCLAAFMISCGVDYYSAVETVRTEHCKKAIETVSQERYLHELYVQVMEEELDACEKDPENFKARIVDLKEDIAYAVANKPQYSSTTKGWGYGWTADDEDERTVTKPTTPAVSNATIFYYAGQEHKGVQSGTPLASAIASGRHVKTVGAVIFVEECININCLTVGCTQKDHQAWKTWDTSMSKVECGVASQF